MQTSGPQSGDVKTGAAERDDAAEIAERLKRLDALGPLDVRRAYATLSPVIAELPGADHLLLGPECRGALGVLLAHDPEIYLAYRSKIRQACGRHFVDILDAAVGKPRSAPPREIVLRSPAEVLASPAPSWLIRDFLPSTGLGVLFGEPATGKSFFAMDLSLCIATGQRYRDRRTHAGGVVYLAAEGSTRPRLEAYARHHQLELDEVRIRLIEQSIALRGPNSDIAGLIDKLKLAGDQLGGVRLVVVDTLNRAFGGGNESASDDVGEFLAALELVSSTIDGLVLVLHHAGKNAALGARGHSSLRAAADVEVELTRAPGGLRTAKVTKLRDGEDGQEFAFRLEAVDLGAHPDPEAEQGERWGSCIVVATDEHAAVTTRRRPVPAGAQVALDALKTAIGMHGEFMPRTGMIPGNVRAVAVDRWRSAYESVTPIEPGLDGADARRVRDARRVAFRRAIERLQAEKLVHVYQAFAWLA